MAAVGVVMPAPVVCINWLALAAAVAVVCLWIVSLWAVHAFLALLAAALIVGLVVCDALALVIYALLLLLLVVVLWPVAAVLLITFVELYTNQLDKGATIVEAHLNATGVFAYLEAFGFLLKLPAAKDSHAERIACVIMLVPPFGISAMCCLVSIPACAVRVWRMRRCTTFASVVPI